MSSRSHCVVAIIEKSTAVAMKRHGGKKPALIRPFPPVPYGWKAIHYPQCAATTKAESNGVRLTKRSQFLKLVPNDLLQQIEANRRNSLKSTGPKMETGKQAPRRNAIRHGLTAETVIGALEDAEDYKAFEAAVAAGFDAETAVERELVLRLASLLWRLRRATAIDTGLLETSTEPDTVSDLDSAALPHGRAAVDIVQIGTLKNHTSLEDSDNIPQNDTLNSAITRRFLQLDCKAFERLGRYETALWRQVYQVIFVLNVLRRQNLEGSWLPRSLTSPRFRQLGSFFPKP
jgi:hypothetical protein